MGNSIDLSTNLSLLRGLADPSKREAAWRAFFDRYQPLISGWCMRRGLDHADTDDITSAVLSRLVSLMCSFEYDPRLRFRGWLKTVVVNEVRGLWRLRRRRPWDRGVGGPEGCHGGQDGDAGGVEELVLALDNSLERDLRLAADVMERAKARVELRTWLAFWRTEFDDEPPVVVGRSLGMTVAAVYMARRRVLRILREEGEGLSEPER